MVERSPGGPDARVVSFLTTEHFTLQTERASATAEINARVQLYMTTLSATLISLALVAQLSDVGDAFRWFAMVLLPTVFAFGLVTIGRLGQAWLAWHKATVGMARIRRFYTDVAPETRPYLVMPTTDDPMEVLGGSGIGDGPRWLQGMYTAPAAVAIVNSVVAGVFAGFAASVLTDGSDVASALVGGTAFVVSFAAHSWFSGRVFRRRLGSLEVAFPA